MNDNFDKCKDCLIDENDGQQCIDCDAEEEALKKENDE